MADPRTKSRINFLFSIPVDDLRFDPMNRGDARTPKKWAICDDCNHRYVPRPLPRRILRIEKNKRVFLTQVHCGSADANEVWFQFWLCSSLLQRGGRRRIGDRTSLRRETRAWNRRGNPARVN